MGSAVIGAAVKTAPPVAIAAGAALGAIDMTFLVGVGTLVYLSLQSAYLCWKWYTERKAKQK